ncbi:Hypothetical protein CINCED_3A008797 [Cinara cedri]|uniref:Mariner Mos1 transposase n=1 Tax=Cinara cedri TaxID=506608 RepID=A0A5E4MEC3_9HEMI|nr:Hypothetical protein CINCED_3A008797 [Cinara cedri]
MLHRSSNPTLKHSNGMSYPTRRIVHTLRHPITLFRSMQHSLADQHFSNYEEVKNWIDSWILEKPAEFFRKGIRELPDKWEKFIASDGQYFEY